VQTFSNHWPNYNFLEDLKSSQNAERFHDDLWMKMRYIFKVRTDYGIEAFKQLINILNYEDIMIKFV